MNTDKSLKDHIAEAIQKPGIQLPVFNPAALELQKIMQDENVSNAQIEATLQSDPALAVQVLRMANSSLYAGLSEITTLRQALMRVGSKQILRLAMAAAQLGLYRSKSPLCRRYMEEMWRAASASATGAAWLAEKSGHGALSEQAFLAGLLHDVGKLVILRVIEEIAAAPPNGKPIPDNVITEMLDALHCEYGYDLMRRWNLPEQYCLVGREHHAPDCNTGNVLMVTVRLADQICRKLGVGCDAEPELMPAASDEAAALRIGEIQLADLEVTLEDQVGLLAA
ncbi:MAG: HDOD domain-containing protein [Burkholderiales bacterium]